MNTHLSTRLPPGVPRRGAGAYGPSAAATSRVSLVRSASCSSGTPAGADRQQRQGAQHGAPLGGVAVLVERVGLRRGSVGGQRGQQQRPGRVVGGPAGRRRPAGPAAAAGRRREQRRRSSAGSAATRRSASSSQPRSRYAVQRGPQSIRCRPSRSHRGRGAVHAGGAVAVVAAGRAAARRKSSDAGGHGGRGVRVAGQFDGDQAAVAGVAQGAAAPAGSRSRPSPNSRCSCTPRRMSSICTLTRCVGRPGARSRHRRRLQAAAVADVEGEAEAGRVAERRRAAGASRRSSRRACPARARSRAATPAASAASTTGRSRRPAGPRRRLGDAVAGPDPGPEARPPRRPGRRRSRRPGAGSRAAGSRSSCSRVGRVLVPRVEQVAGAGLDDHGQPERRAAGRPTAATRRGEVRARTGRGGRGRG